MADLKHVHYDAFISYRHADLDNFVAGHLHRKLESFRLPKSVHEKVKGGKTRIERVFRDVDELPLSDNLTEPIKQALDNSDYLITVCTPRYLESSWCMKEIELFLQNHDRKHILVVLAEGEPENAFPEILTYEEIVGEDEAGKEVKVRREIEPLAADTRGKDRKEVLKALDNAVIQLCAAMFGLTYDELKQRHREQIMRRRLTWSGAVGAVILIVAVFAIFALIQISALNKLISVQYKELEDKYAGTMADTAIKISEDGRKKDAVYALRDVLPDHYEEDCNAEALTALYSFMDVYAEGVKRSPVECYDFDSTVWSFRLSSNNKYLMTNDFRRVVVFELESGRKVLDISSEDEEGLSDFRAAFCGEDGYLLKDINGLYYGKFDSDDRKQLLEDNTYYDFIQTPDGSMTMVSRCDEGVAELMAVSGDGNIVYKKDLTPYHSGDNIANIQVSFNGERMVTAIFDWNQYAIIVANTEDGSELMHFESEGNYNYMSLDAIIDHNILYQAVSKYSENTGDTFCHVIAYKLSNGLKLWETEVNNLNIDGLYIAGDTLYAMGVSNLALIDLYSGELEGVSLVGEMPVDAWVEDDEFYYMTDAYNVHHFGEYGESVITDDFFKSIPKGEASVAFYSNGDMYIADYRENYLVKYSATLAEGAELIWPDGKDEELFYNLMEDQHYHEADGMEFMKEIDGFDTRHLEEAFFSEDNRYVVATMTNGVVILYDAQSREETATYELDDSLFISLWPSENTGCYILSGSSYTYLLDKNFNVICKMGRVISEEPGYFYVYRILSRGYTCIVKLPYVDYDELIRRTDAYLGDYEPAEVVLVKYNMREKNDKGK